jgi:hypothetical protein
MRSVGEWSALIATFLTAILVILQLLNAFPV